MPFKTFERGDIILVDFSPSLGHEQKGYRLALVWTNRASQQVSGFASVFPITSHDKGYPLHVRLGKRVSKVKGVIMTDQITTIDLEIRSVRKIAHVGNDILYEVAEIFADMTE